MLTDQGSPATDVFADFSGTNDSLGKIRIIKLNQALLYGRRV